MAWVKVADALADAGQHGAGDHRHTLGYDQEDPQAEHGRVRGPQGAQLCGLRDGPRERRGAVGRQGPPGGGLRQVL